MKSWVGSRAMLPEITTVYKKYSYLLDMKGSSSPSYQTWPKLIGSLATRVPMFNDYSNWYKHVRVWSWPFDLRLRTSGWCTLAPAVVPRQSGLQPAPLGWRRPEEKNALHSFLASVLKFKVDACRGGECRTIFFIVKYSDVTLPDRREGKIYKLCNCFLLAQKLQSWKTWKAGVLHCSFRRKFMHSLFMRQIRPPYTEIFKSKMAVFMNRVSHVWYHERQAERRPIQRHRWGKDWFL